MENNLTLEQLQHYPKGKNGIKVKLNEKGIRELWYDSQEANYLEEVFYIKSIDYDYQTCELVSVEDEKFIVDEINFDCFLPIFFSLDCLTKEIEVDGEKFVPTVWFMENFIDYNISKSDMQKLISMFLHTFTSPKSAPYYFVEQLFKWHFDVFSLIEKGKAININTINLK